MWTSGSHQETQATQQAAAEAQPPRREPLQPQPEPHEEVVEAAERTPIRPAVTRIWRTMRAIRPYPCRTGSTITEHLPRSPSSLDHSVKPSYSRWRKRIRIARVII